MPAQSTPDARLHSRLLLPVAGSKYHRPAEHTHTTASRNLQGLALLAAGEGGGSAGGRSRKDADEEPAVELLEDENDDLCHVCGLGVSR